MRGTLLPLDTGVNLPQCYHLAMQSDHQETSLTADQRARVAALLGREPGLPTEQCGHAGALISCERGFLMIRLHSQMVTLGQIDPSIEWE